MKWLVGFLAVLNAALFLWATGHNPGQAGAAAHPVVSAESMRLLSEVKARKDPAADAGVECARIGPFVSSAVASLAAQKLDAMSLSYRRHTVEAREIRAFRVFLGPFESESALEAQRRLLEAGGVKDYYVKSDGRVGAGIISLGLFSQREGAEDLLAKLERSDVQARLRTEDRVLKPNYWLEIDDPAVAHHIPPEIAGASWGGNDARLRRYNCR